MKKVISILLAVVMVVLCFAACGKTEAPQETKSDFLVGAVYITSQNETAGYTFAHHSGITKAMEELGLPKENLKIVDNISDQDKTAVSNAIDTLANQGCKIIFGISFGYIDAFDEAAKKPEYADIIFSHATGFKSNDKNFNNYFGRIYQARYLAGIAAGLKSLELKNDSIGYVTAWGTEYAETCSGINAFALGVQAVNPKAIVHVNQISTWGDLAKEKAAAQELINTYNCGVIAQHCDSPQPQLAAADGKVFGCGYNSDMTPQAPSAHLTAPIWNWNVYYKLAIETAMQDPANFMTKVGNYYGGLKEGFVAISPLSDNCTENTKAIIDKVQKMIVDGEWDVFTNVKLSIDAQGNVTKVTEALKDNKGAVVIAEDGNTYFTYDKDSGELVAQDGGKAAQDGVIKGSMNYYVTGVQDNTAKAN